MGDDTFYPSSMYPGGSEDDFADLRKRTVRGITKRHQAFCVQRGWTTSTTTLEKLALVASEVGEAVNECRGLTPTTQLASELADIVLRTCNVASCEGIDLEAAILAKMDANDQRDFTGKIK